MNIQDSLRRVLEERDTVATTFYEVFFERTPEARPLFDGVNMKHQAVLLTMALMVIERHHAHGYPSTALYLKYLGHKHHLRGVPPEMYPKWAEALLATLARFHGPDWDEEAAGQWRSALEGAAQVMLVGYREPVHV
jgi:hemoglobin-like flavoprotein